MIIGLVGSGGREHALARALTRRGKPHRLVVYASGPNPGIKAIAGNQYQMGDLADAGSIAKYFLGEKVELAVIGPEAPLMTGVVDLLRSEDILAVGPTQSQARLEGDKAFMRDLLRRRVGWGSPAWRVAEDIASAADFIRETGDVAVKPIGLTGGKGVQVMGVQLKDQAEALAEAARWIEHDGQVLLEERLVGEEFSRMVFASDGHIIPMPVAQDYKYAFDGDTGGMTGGMGAYTHASGGMTFLSHLDLAEADRLITEVLAALEIETGEPYRGFLYGQFMTTRNGLRIIEFNARLGDPEAINMMALFDGDLPHLLGHLAAGRIDPDAAVFRRQASVVKYMVPNDYPGAQKIPYNFDLDIDQIQQHGFDVILSSVKREGGHWQTLGSRTMALVGLGTEPGGISARMEQLMKEIEPPGLRHRKDVGDAAVLQARAERMVYLKGGMNKQVDLKFVTEIYTIDLTCWYNPTTQQAWV